MWFTTFIVALILTTVWIGASASVGALRYRFKPLYLIVAGSLLLLFFGLGHLDVPVFRERYIAMPSQFAGTGLYLVYNWFYAKKLEDHGIDFRKMLFFQDARIPPTRDGSNEQVQ